MKEPTADQIVKALRDVGLTVVEIPNWRTRCRCCNGEHRPDASSYVRKWTGFLSLGVHQTYGRRLYGEAAYEYAERVLSRVGNGVTPGGLCLAGIDGDGIWYMTAMGRANHMGGISKAAQERAVYGTWSLSDNYDDVRGYGYDGNAISVGLECMSSDAPNDAQRDSMVLGTAALGKLAGFDGGNVFGHGEASNQRAYDDPNLDMGSFRRAVNSRLKVILPGNVPGASTTEDMIMAITTATQQDFNTLLANALKDSRIKALVGVAADSATYGIDLDGDGKAETRGNIDARNYKVDVETQKRVSQLIDENKDLRETIKELNNKLSELVSLLTKNV